MKLWQWQVALVVDGCGSHRAGPGAGEAAHDRGGRRGRNAAAGAENVVVALLRVAALSRSASSSPMRCSAPARMPNELLGLCLGLPALHRRALTVIAKRLVLTEELEDDYPQEHPRSSRDRRDVHEGGSRITRKRLLHGRRCGGRRRARARGAHPGLSLGPFWDTGRSTGAVATGRPARRRDGRPLARRRHLSRRPSTPPSRRAPTREEIGSPLVVIRLDPSKLQLPPGRRLGTGRDRRLLEDLHPRRLRDRAVPQATSPGRAPRGAGLPMPLLDLRPVHRRDRHLGPAGRPLPQLPLEIDDAGNLRAAGNFSARVGPGWST